MERLKDPEYLGWRHERVTGQAYFDFVDQFVQAVKQELPNPCLQWEDFATPHARPILERYRDELLTFNDDIQGTAAVALGAILGAVIMASLDNGMSLLNVENWAQYVVKGGVLVAAVGFDMFGRRKA